MRCPAILDNQFPGDNEMVLGCKRDKGHEGPCFPDKWRFASPAERHALQKAREAVNPDKARQRWG